MADDAALRDHQIWIKYLQPEGLVVSPAALVDSQVVLDRAQLARIQQEFLPFTTDADVDDETVTVLRSLSDFVCEFLGWSKESLLGTSTNVPIPDQLIVDLPEFGETLRPDFALCDAKPADPERPWLILIKELASGAALDDAHTGHDQQWSASAARRFERLLRETGVPIGLLSNRTAVRLIYAPHGENSGSLTFPVGAMCEMAGRPIVGALHLLLDRFRLFAAGSEERLPALLRKSREYQSGVSAALAGQVLDSLYELLRGFQAANDRAKGELLREVIANRPDDMYTGLLTVMLRLVFLLYAEDREITPKTGLYVQNYSVHTVFERLRADYERYPDTIDHRYGAWAQLLALFRAVFIGSKHPKLKMPARKGYLFDPDRYAFLEGRPDIAHGLPLVSDGVVFRVLRNLLMLDGERLSYRTLDVEQIGSVYERMMGFKIEVAEGTTIAVRPAKAHGAPTAINLERVLAEKPADRAKWLLTHGDQKLTGKPADDLKQARTIDDLLVALEKKIARNATPHPVPKGAVVLQPSDERRRSSSHYTPRSFTGPIVERALKPILEALGENPTPRQILDLKICDPAVGSGAFLVETCRQLGDELVRAWRNHNQVPYIPPDEDETLLARRIVAQRCLYGVDRNPMAVDLAKLSLWLATLAREHPFTFLDHNLRCGDSLVGLTRHQLGDFHWREEPVRVLGQDKVEKRIQSATASRKEILDADDEFISPETKRQKLDLADEALEPMRQAGDCVVAAFFGSDKDKERLARRDEMLRIYTEFPRTFKELDATIQELHGGRHPLRPFHWEIEFPEVFDRDNGGFDAIVGNPPFAGKNTLINSNREEYLDWLKTLHDDSHGNSDLVAHFFRRAFNLIREDGCFGLIATNTIAQGDTRHTGLRWICTHGGTIYSARRRYRWPGEAAVVVSVVHLRKGSFLSQRLLDETPTSRITAFLFHVGDDDDPKQLKANRGKSYIGSYVLGMGFTFDDSNSEATTIAEMNRLIEKDPRNKDRIFPYIGGEEVNRSPKQSFHRYVINFDEMELREAKQWPDLIEIIERKVKPERDRLGENPDARRRKEHWWQFGRYTPALFEATSELKRVLVVSRVGQACAFAFIQSGWVPAESLVVFASDSWALFALLQSRVHEVWARFFSSSMKDDLRYAPSDCFETFPFPSNDESLSLEPIAQRYYEFRAELMVKNTEGLTSTYNRFHNESETSPEIKRLRELHDLTDRAVLDSYGWADIRPVCEFLRVHKEDDEEDTEGRRSHYRWPDEIRDEVLARLLALNAQRAANERLAGVTAEVGTRPRPQARRARRVSSAQASFQTVEKPEE
jgi:hypothetical protein